MYQQFFGLSAMPFDNTPNPKFFYEDEQHAEAFARIAYVLREKRSCAVLTGVYGCGKTMVVQAVKKELDNEGYRFSLVTNPQLDNLDMLRMIQHGFKDTEISRQKADVLMALEKTIKEIASDGKHAVIIIDEAHTIEEKGVFEELRLLLNYQTETSYLVSLVLVGQPELSDKIESNKQFNQRVAIKCHLGPYDEATTRAYINHRLGIACSAPGLFNDEALAVIFQRSGGIPRWINNMCHMSLMTAFSKNERTVGAPTVKEALLSMEGNG